MNFLVYTPEERASYPVCLLVPTIRKDEIHKAYVEGTDLHQDDLLVVTLHNEPGRKKTPMPVMRAYITEELVPVFEDMGVEYILCADAEYFKALTKAVKVEAHLGYVMDCAFGPQKVIYVPNYRTMFSDPVAVKGKIVRGIQALTDHRLGGYHKPGTGIIKSALYPKTDQEIENALVDLIERGQDLASDIEGFSLKHYNAGLGSISFAWNKHEGIAFAIDYVESDEEPGLFGKNVRNEPRRKLLRRFFELCRENGIKIMWHNIAFDVYVLIYQLFMTDILDQEGLLYGLEVMLGDQGEWDCTKLITYLATNSCAGNKLGLKDQAQSFAGNYAVEEIKDIRKIPLPKLLEYNLVDSLSTWFVYEKHQPTLVSDQQLTIYKTLFQPATVDIIQMQLTGMPVNMAKVLEVEQRLLKDEALALDAIRQSATIQRYTYRLNEKWVEKRNNELKVKRVTLADAKEIFNPNSAPQLQDLLFNFLGLPVLSKTKAKQPGTDGDTIEALQHHTNDKDVLAFLKGLENYKSVNKIITDFIPSLKNAQLGPDGWHYLFGNFNLGGTKSGRLSSSDPNLQNLPANSKYAKWIKECFEAAPGWLFCGLDFASLEDRISALTSTDPNKLKVYTDGYDGHSLRAYAYFGNQMPDIIDTVESINTIQKLYGSLRYDSKAPTFALTYQGTFATLMKNCGFSEEKAKSIEKKYHELYEVSDRWVATKLDEASRVGYVTIAFGLRLRTPMLKQVIRGTSKTPQEAEREGRTAGNALGQSYCLLNSRAGVEFNGKVRKSQHRLNIRPSAQIHDAQYFIIKDDISAISYTNEHLVKAVQWQEDPDIAHDEVKLGGELSIFYPTWKTEITIPNYASDQEIFEIVDKAMA